MTWLAKSVSAFISRQNKKLKSQWFKQNIVQFCFTLKLNGKPTNFKLVLRDNETKILCVLLHKRTRIQNVYYKMQ